MRHALPLMLSLLACGAATAAVAASGRDAKGGREQCFWPRNVTGFEPVRGQRDRIRITVNQRDIYELDVVGCPDVDLALHLALVNRGGMGQICHPEDAELVAPSPEAPHRCRVSAIRRITPEALATEKAARQANRR